VLEFVSLILGTRCFTKTLKCTYILCHRRQKCFVPVDVVVCGHFCVINAEEWGHKLFWRNFEEFW
jgi:hypothetical protein